MMLFVPTSTGIEGATQCEVPVAVPVPPVEVCQVTFTTPVPPVAVPARLIVNSSGFKMNVLSRHDRGEKHCDSDRCSSCTVLHGI
jgi:hypothetical protein